MTKILSRLIVFTLMACVAVNPLLAVGVEKFHGSRFNSPHLVFQEQALSPVVEMVGTFLGQRSTNAKVKQWIGSATRWLAPKKEPVPLLPERVPVAPVILAPQILAKLHTPYPVMTPHPQASRPQLRTLLYKPSDQDPEIVAPLPLPPLGSIDKAILKAHQLWTSKKLKTARAAEQIVKVFQASSTSQKVTLWQTAGSFLKTLSRPEWQPLAAFMQKQTPDSSVTAIPAVQTWLAKIHLGVRLQMDYPTVFGFPSEPNPVWLATFLKSVFEDRRLWVRKEKDQAATLKTIFELRFIEGKTLQEIGSHFGFTTERARQREAFALRILRARGVLFQRNFDPAKSIWNEDLAAYDLMSSAQVLLRKKNIHTVGDLVTAIRQGWLPVTLLEPFAVTQIQRLVRAHHWLSASHRGMPNPLDESVHDLPFSRHNHRAFSRLQNGPLFTYRQLFDFLRKPRKDEYKVNETDIFSILYRAGLLPGPSFLAAKRLWRDA